jgi:hypothetical protein
VVEAVTKEDSLDKPPADFHPAIGAKVPAQAKLSPNPLPRPLLDEIPALKQYCYARLPDRRADHRPDEQHDPRHDPGVPPGVAGMTRTRERA